MRALILSDIHANIDALDALLACAPPYDTVWNLGDVVGYGAAPNAVIDRVRAMNGLVIRGNHDRACCGLDAAENFNPIALAAVRWTQSQLPAENTEWLKALPAGPIQPPGGGALCVHGSLRNEDEYLLGIREAAEQMVPPATSGEQTRIAFFGHTHIQGGFFADADGCWCPLRMQYRDHEAAEEFLLDLREGASYLINPGSVGQPRDNDWRAAFALYDTDTRQVKFHRVPYDVHMAQMRIQRAGLPEKLGTRLRLGR